MVASDNNSVGDRAGSNVEESNVIADSGSARISKEGMAKTILSMDAHKRRQLIEQPRSSMSHYFLDHLVQENQTAKARKLSTQRFRINTSAHSLYNEMDMVSTSETHIDLSSLPSELSDEIMEQVKELIKEIDDVSQTAEDDEIQVLAPPVKEPPPCIDLDVDAPIPTPPSGTPSRFLFKIHQDFFVINDVFCRATPSTSNENLKNLASSGVPECDPGTLPTGRIFIIHRKYAAIQGG